MWLRTWTWIRSDYIDLRENVMDLVEIRKKAKSRKKKEEERAAVRRKGKDSGAETDSAPGEEPVSEPGIGPAEDPVKPQEEAYTEHVEKNGADNRGETDQAPESLTNLKGILLSQQEADEEEEEEKLQLLVFLLGQEEYALNIMDIKEIIRPMEVTEVPKAPEYIQGIISLRGMIIPVMDVNKRLGLPVREHGHENRIIVVKWREHLFGLFVDSVVQVMNLPLARIEPPPEILGGVEGEFLRGVGKVEDRLIILLNLVRILALEEEEISERKQPAPEKSK
jgi:purine-binding chemotaxis protein CheW